MNKRAAATDIVSVGGLLPLVLLFVGRPRLPDGVDPSSLAATSGTEEARIWSLDNFGEDLLACVRDGELFYWDKTNGLSTRAEALTARGGADQVPNRQL